MTDIQKHLQTLIKEAGTNRNRELDKRAEDISAKIDNAEDGTSPAATGERAAENKADAGAYTEAAVDKAAPTNPANASVDKSTDGATAGTDQHGGQGADLTPVKDADNGAEKPENKVAVLLKGARALADALRKEAAAITEQVAEPKAVAKTAAAAEKPELDKLGAFLVHLARNSADEDFRKVASEMDDAALADQATGEMLAGLESGDIDDETAGQIVNAAEEFGAMGPEDVASATAEVEEQIAQDLAAGKISEEEAVALLRELVGDEELAASADDAAAAELGAMGEAGEVSGDDIKTAADELAGGEAAAAEQMAVEELLAAIEAGEVSEEEAGAILAELEAATAADGGEAGPVADPTAEDVATAEAIAGPEVADAIASEDKLAYLLNVDENHPDYPQKLAAYYADVEAAGAAAFDALADDLLAKEAEAEEGKSQEEAVNDAQPDTNADATDQGNPDGPAGPSELTDSIPTETTNDKLAYEVGAEMGLDDETIKKLLEVKVASLSDEEKARSAARADLLARAATLKN